MISPLYSWPWWISICSIGLGLWMVLWGVHVRGLRLMDYFRGKRARDRLFADRATFSDEEVDLEVFLRAGQPTVTGKHFRRCVLRGPVALAFIDKCPLNDCSAPDGALENRTAAAGEAAIGFYETQFDHCYFATTVILNDITYPRVAPGVRIERLRAWRARHG